MKKIVSGIMLTLLLMSTLSLVINIKHVKSTWTGTIYIRADGSIDPSWAPIERDGDIYTLTSDILWYSIVVERDNIVIDGAGHILYGNEELWSKGIDLHGRINVTIMNLKITNFYYGIQLWGSSNNSITANIIIHNAFGIKIYESSNNNITENIVEDNRDVFTGFYIGAGIEFDSSSSNIVSRNKIINNQEGIRVYSSSHNVITENNVTTNTYFGMSFTHSSNNTIVGNIFVGDGLVIEESYYNVVAHNFVNGKPLVYLEGATALTVEGELGSVILINCENINLQNLRIFHTDCAIQLVDTKNTLISKNNITGNLWGICLSNSSNNKIIENIVENNSGPAYMTFPTGGGIGLSRSSNNIIARNNINANAHGIIIAKSSYNTVYKNNIIANQYGITLNGYGPEAGSSNNIISRNNIINNGVGISIIQSSNNIIVGNDISANVHNGVFLGKSYDNKFFHNNFIDNKRQIFSWESINVWDDGYPSGGNYWSDYTGVDEKSGQDQDQPGSDGIGDTPYILDAVNIDKYPLMNRWLPYEHDLDVSFEVHAVLVPGRPVLLNATVTNLGLVKEVNVELILMINGVMVSSVTISDLAVDESYTLSFEWTPTMETAYNITAYAPPVDGEVFIVNNVKSRVVKVTSIIATAIIVPDYYPTIQEAINAAYPEDFIFVRAGTYYENVVVNKALLLMGENAIIEGSHTIIDGGGKGDVVTINADGVNLTGFTIKNSGEWYAGIRLQNVRDCNISRNILIKNHYAAILLKNSINNMIYENMITANKLHGIYLRESSNNLVFRNNVVANDKVWCFGISVYASSYNNIFENNVTSNFHGIWLSLSSYNNVTQNRVADNNSHGILIVGSSNNSVIENMVTNNGVGIMLQGSSHNTVSENTMITNRDSGVWLDRSKYNNISANIFVHDGIYTTYSGEDVKGNIVKDNTVNGKPIIYLEDKSNIIIEDAVGQVILINCENATIQNLNISRTTCAIQLRSSNNINISKTFLVNNLRGISLHNSSNCSLSGNNVIKNSEGIILSMAFNNTIFRNNIACNDYGVWLESSSNKFYHNNFIDNIEQIHIYNSTNVWDSGYPSGGNYWSNYDGMDLRWGLDQDNTGSDGIGDTKYEISLSNVDRYPLMAPFAAFDAGIWNGVIYSVGVVSNSTISGFYFNPEEGAFLRFNVTGENGTKGFCRVTIPKRLLWVEDRWTITVGNQQIIDYLEIKDENFTYLYFTYNHSTKTVTIQGTHVIPELSPSLIFLLFIIPSIVALVLSKRKLQKLKT